MPCNNFRWDEEVKQHFVLIHCKCSNTTHPLLKQKGAYLNSFIISDKKPFHGTKKYKICKTMSLLLKNKSNDDITTTIVSSASSMVIKNTSQLDNKRSTKCTAVAGKKSKNLKS